MADDPAPSTPPTQMSDDDFAALQASFAAAETDFAAKEATRLTARAALVVQRTAYGVLETVASAARASRDSLEESVAIQTALRGP